MARPAAAGSVHGMRLQKNPRLGRIRAAAVEDSLRGSERLGCFGGACPLGRVLGVLQFVASAAQPAEVSQGRAELGPDRLVDGIVPTCGGGAKSLLGEQRDASLPGGVIGQHDAAVGRGTGNDPGRAKVLPCPLKPRFPVGLRALHSLDMPPG